jgi:hypothetical protein
LIPKQIELLRELLPGMRSGSKSAGATSLVACLP